MRSGGLHPTTRYDRDTSVSSDLLQLCKNLSLPLPPHEVPKKENPRTIRLEGFLGVQHHLACTRLRSDTAGRPSICETDEL